MRIYLCILLSKKNSKFLKDLLNSIEKLKSISYIKLTFVFVIDQKIKYKKNFIKKIITKFNFIILVSNKDSIPYSRNLFLKFLKKKDYDFAGFIDDDCIMNNNWLFNMNKFIKENHVSVVGGPQKHLYSNKFFKLCYEYLEPHRDHGSKVEWVATNNCLFSKKIFELKNIKFNENLKNFGGSDQLFFKKLSVNNYLIKWNAKSYVIENIQKNRENLKWFFKRNFRYGYSGNIIDESIYPRKFIFIIVLKILYLLLFSIFFLILPSKKNLIKSNFFFARACGRLAGLFNYKPKKYI